MESVSTHIQKIEDSMQKMEDLLAAARPVPFSNKINVDKIVIYEILDDIIAVMEEMKRDLPGEIIQAKRVIADSDKILTDAKNKAKSILNSAETDVENMISEHSISQQAMEQASQIMDEAKKSARELRINAIEYADEILAKTEQVVRESLNEFIKTSRHAEEYFSDTIDIIYENRQELRPKS